MSLAYDVNAARGALVLAGGSTLTFARAQERYEMVSETQALALFRATQRSSGKVKAGVLVPVEYSEERTGRSAFKTTFDWPAGQVKLAASGEDHSEPTQPLLQDRLSLLLQLGLALRSRPLQAHIALPVAGARRVSMTRFERQGEESLEVPAGRFDTVKLERPRDEDNDRIEVWIAPALCWLPARIRYTDRRGSVIDHRLRSATGA